MDNLKKLAALLKEEQKTEEEIVKEVEALTQAATVSAMGRVLEVLGENEGDSENLVTEEQIREVYEAKTGKKLNDLVVEELDRLAGEYLQKRNKVQA